MENTIYRRLKKFYKISIIPAVIFFVVIQITGRRIVENFRLPDNINVLLVVLSLLFALVFPIAYRIFNFFHVNSNGAMSEKRFIIFEKVLIIISQIAIYIMIVGSYIVNSRIIMIVLSIVAFYSLYYYYPTEKKINFDKRIFMPIKRGKSR